MFGFFTKKVLGRFWFFTKNGFRGWWGGAGGGAGQNQGWFGAAWLAGLQGVGGCIGGRQVQGPERRWVAVGWYGGWLGIFRWGVGVVSWGFWVDCVGWRSRAFVFG